MDMQNYTTPFANTGDTEEFSIDTDPQGKVSLEKGWTELYQLRPEEGGLFILRKVFNQMMKLVSTDTVTWKTQSFPNWINDKGDGLPFAYPKNAIVKYTNGNNYVSLVNNNTQVPTGANWKLFDIAALDSTVKLSGNQTIAGVKTFSSSPIVPTPTTGTQAVNKTYADTKQAKNEVAYNINTSSFILNTLASGAIIERGSNANGEYVKYANGTLICNKILESGGTGAIESSSGVRGSTVSQSPVWTFPVEFIEIPFSFSAMRAVSGNSPYVCTDVDFTFLGTASQVRFRIFDFNGNDTPTTISAFAIGKWK